jgi:hypothetical protein
VGAAIARGPGTPQQERLDCARGNHSSLGPLALCLCDPKTRTGTALDGRPHACLRCRREACSKVPSTCRRDRVPQRPLRRCAPVSLDEPAAPCAMGRRYRPGRVAVRCRQPVPSDPSPRWAPPLAGPASLRAVAISVRGVAVRGVECQCDASLQPASRPPCALAAAPRLSMRSGRCTTAVHARRRHLCSSPLRGATQPARCGRRPLGPGGASHAATTDVEAPGYCKRAISSAAKPITPQPSHAHGPALVACRQWLWACDPNRDQGSASLGPPSAGNYRRRSESQSRAWQRRKRPSLWMAACLSCMRHMRLLFSQAAALPAVFDGDAAPHLCPGGRGWKNAGTD